MSSTPEITVIIPTRNRRVILTETLHRYQRQTLASEAFMVLVIDDGSQDGTREQVQELIPRMKYRLRYQPQENRGPAAARNLGIRLARSPLLLFTGDDIFPHPELLAYHLTGHRRFSASRYGILGQVEWPPELPVSRFMHYITRIGGQQFNFHAIEDPFDVSFGHFTTANVSIKSDVLQGRFFDEDFSQAAYEDVELGFRLAADGFRLIYLPEALGYHYHPTDLPAFCERQRRAGRMAALLARKHPALKDWLLGSPISSPVPLAEVVAAARELESINLERLTRVLSGLENNNVFEPLLYHLYNLALSMSYWEGVQEGQNADFSFPTRRVG